ncbi:MAG TPA: HD domain-containing protein [Acidimicrobiales bacterium]|nr:HD domain-containing protein [Acidimicrobiales bacterium]
MTGPVFAGPRHSPAVSVDDIVEVLEASPGFDLTERPGPRHHLLDHSLQTAEVLRRSHPDDLELQLAGLVHDIGHLLPPHRDDAHAEVAAVFVRPVLGDRVAGLVRLHVSAKRYLVTTDPDYRGSLDQGSVFSLRQQGGDMAPAEVLAFEQEPLVADALVLRRADEAGKVPGLSVPGLDSWTAALDQYAVG